MTALADRYAEGVNVWDFIGSYWWLVFPIGGALSAFAGGWARAVRRWDERRREHKLEMAKIKYGHDLPEGADSGGHGHTGVRKPARRRSEARGQRAAAETRQAELQRLTAEHDQIDQRWLAYELDLAKLIEFPVMSDMREEVTVDFHRAKRAADGLRPDDLTAAEAQSLAAYREAVREYAISFEVAEREAKRRRATDFTPEERRTLERAKRLLALAEDSGATHAERQQAYRRTQQTLQGLIAIPDAADEAIQQRIAGALAPSTRSPSTQRPSTRSPSTQGPSALSPSTPGRRDAQEA